MGAVRRRPRPVAAAGASELVREAVDDGVPDARHLPGPPAGRGRARRARSGATRRGQQIGVLDVGWTDGGRRRPRCSAPLAGPTPRRCSGTTTSSPGCPTAPSLLARTPRRRGAGGPVRAVGVGGAVAPRGRRGDRPALGRPRPRRRRRARASTWTPTSPTSAAARDRARRGAWRPLADVVRARCCARARAGRAGRGRDDAAGSPPPGTLVRLGFEDAERAGRLACARSARRSRCWR